jgi:Tfp pilus assembly protein PilF
MLRRGVALVFPLLLLMSGMAMAQTNRPLFLDQRPGEDPSVIDVTEVTGFYSKEAVEEYEKGIDQGRKGNRAAAREHLEAAIRIEPGFFNAHNSLAVLFHQSSQFDDAEREYREAARLNPMSVAPYINLASLNIEESVLAAGRDGQSARRLLNDALSNLNKAFEIQPAAPLAHYLSGLVYYMTGFDEESESHLKKALTTGGPNMIRARLALAEIYIRLKEWDGVVVQLDEYLDQYPFAPNRARVRSVRNAAAERLTSSTQ